LVAEEKMRLLKEKEKKMEDLRREKEATEMLSAKIKVEFFFAMLSYFLQAIYLGYGGNSRLLN